MEIISIFIALLALFGGIALSATEENRDTLARILMITALLSVSVHATSTIATMSYESCTKRSINCPASQFFTETVKFPSHDKPFREKVMLSVSWFTALNLYLMLALLSRKEKIFKSLPTIGVSALLASGVLTVYQYIFN